MPDLPTPVAGRLQRPSWKDARLIVGVLLVLVAVIVGARVVAMADDTHSVYVAARQIVPGQEVTSDDLVPTQVQLGEEAPQYVDASGGLEAGTFALREVRPGELVPASALGGRQDVGVKAVTVPVDSASAATFVRGSVVDVWISPRDPDSATVQYQEPDLLLSEAVVSRVPEDAAALGVGPAGTAVQIVVPEERVADLIASVDQEASVTLVPTPGTVQRGSS